MRLTLTYDVGKNDADMLLVAVCVVESEKNKPTEVMAGTGLKRKGLWICVAVLV